MMLEAYSVFLQFFICKPLQNHPCNEWPVPRIKCGSLFPFMNSWYLPFFFTYRFWQKYLYCTIIPTFPVSRLTFLFGRGEENAIAWESTDLLIFTNKLSFFSILQSFSCLNILLSLLTKDRSIFKNYSVAVFQIFFFLADFIHFRFSCYLQQKKPLTLTGCDILWGNDSFCFFWPPLN